LSYIQKPGQTSEITMANEDPRSQSTIRSLWGIPLTALLMAAFVLGLFYAYTKAPTLPSFPNPYTFWIFNLLPVGTALGGSIGLRIAWLSWRQIVMSTLLAGVGLVISWRFSAFFLPPDPFLLAQILGGVFLLPLFDPAVRKNGTAPSFGQVALVAFVLSFFMTQSGLYNSFGILIFMLPGLGVLLSLLLSLFREPYVEAGAWVGGVIVLISLLVMILLLRGF
jgi:hypothetical protein